MTILEEIAAYKRAFVEESRRRAPFAEIRKQANRAPAALDFLVALRDPKGIVRVIAEVKKASPSKGIIRPDFDPASIARRYAECGAAAISVLTDEKYFQGSLENLRAIREAVALPLLRKEFIIDEYQIYEARAAGADAILLITAILKDQELSRFYKIARGLEMSVLVEAHEEEEVERALKISPRIIGINNRNLKTMKVDLEQSIRLRPLIPEGICAVSESGIKTARDLALLAEHNIHAALVGEALMQAPDPGNALLTLLGK